VKRFREVTGVRWIESKLFFAGKSPELCERLLSAHIQQPGSRTFHDPVEDHPDNAEIFAAIRESTEKAIRKEIAERKKAFADRDFRDWPLGTCHLFWHRMKTELAAQGIVWYSPAEMNPGHRFD